MSGALWAEAAGPGLRQTDYLGIPTHGSVASVTRQSSKTRLVGMRDRCNTQCEMLCTIGRAPARSMAVALKLAICPP